MSSYFITKAFFIVSFDRQFLMEKLFKFLLQMFAVRFQTAIVIV